MGIRDAWLIIVFGFVTSICVRRCCGSVDAMCTVALQIDCASDYIQQTDETLCATNGHTYVNLCFFSKQKCEQSSLNINHFGACKTTTTAATRKPTSQRPTDATRPLPTTPEPATTARVRPSPTTLTTTLAMRSTTTMDEYEILRKVFCAPESQVNCDLFPKEPYCGSNFVVYHNECEFVRAQCTLDIRPRDMTYCKPNGHHNHPDHPA